MKVNTLDSNIQPKKYSRSELKKLRQFVETVKNDSTRATLACWGNYTKRGW